MAPTAPPATARTAPRAAKTRLRRSAMSWASSATVICAVPSTVARMTSTDSPTRAFTSVMAVFRTPVTSFRIGVSTSTVQFEAVMYAVWRGQRRADEGKDGGTY